MRALVLLFLLTIATRAGADCKDICDDEWWKTATIDDIKNELGAGIDVMSRDAEGITPLHSASMYGTEETIRALLAAGADISARNECGSTPLHSAASRGTAETIKALLDGGADVMAEEADGWTPLHRAAACFECPAENIYVLLATGASVMAEDEEGMTPWDYAQENSKLKGTKGYRALKHAQHN